MGKLFRSLFLTGLRIFFIINSSDVYIKSYRLFKGQSCTGARFVISSKIFTEIYSIQVAVK